MFNNGKYFIIALVSIFCKTMFAQQVSSYNDNGMNLLLKDVDLPLVEIWTVDGTEPTGEHISAPEGCWGVTLINNNYLYGRMKISRKGELLYDSNEQGMKIKLRGNTSSTGEKKPYKIKLVKSEDLLFRGDATYKDKDWVLLSVYGGYPSRIFTGSKIGEIVGLEWTPCWEYVNLVINGEYKGDYLLMEPVERGNGRVDIDKTGYLIEDDAYWWSEEVYFKGNMLQNQVGYTFKYPDTDDLNDSIISNIQSFILDFEETLLNNGDISEYIDIRSWAAWLLAQDILGQKDSGGTNRFMYKKDYDESNPCSTKLKMGPLWDFDGSLVRSDCWADIHNRSYSFYYTELLKHPDFYESYLQLWDSVKNILLDELSGYYESLIRMKGEGIDRSRVLNKEVYPSDLDDSLEKEFEFAYDWMEKRVAWIDKQLHTTGINESPSTADGHVIYNIYGQRLYNYADLKRGVYIIDGVKVYVR